MSPAHLPKHLVIDNFLPEDFAARLLDHALAGQDMLKLTDVQKSAGNLPEESTRHSWRLADSLGPHWMPFHDAVNAQVDSWFVPLGLAPFPISGFELELVAHRDGDFYRPHIDTFTAGVRASGGEDDNSDRMISAVYYFHRQPKAFTGGELALFPFGSEEPGVLIEPRHNRLAVFPSFALHEVLPVHCPGNRYEDARFAINCWIHRARG